MRRPSRRARGGNLAAANDMWTQDTTHVRGDAWRQIGTLTDVENVVDTPFDDILSGNSAYNRFTYTGGRDVYSTESGFFYDSIEDGFDTILGNNRPQDRAFPDFKDVLVGYDPATSNRSDFVSASTAADGSVVISTPTGGATTSCRWPG